MSFFYEIKFNKPLYKNCIRLWEKHVLNAIKEKKLMKITTPDGVAIQDPLIWRKTGKKYKQVFRRPDEPMPLIENFLDYKTPEQIKNLEQELLIKQIL